MWREHYIPGGLHWPADSGDQRGWRKRFHGNSFPMQALLQDLRCPYTTRWDGWQGDEENEKETRLAEAGARASVFHLMVAGELQEGFIAAVRFPIELGSRLVLQQRKRNNLAHPWEGAWRQRIGLRGTCMRDSALLYVGRRSAQWSQPTHARTSSSRRFGLTVHGEVAGWR